MEWYWVVGPAAGAAIAIRLDALWIGPYWSFTEVVAGIGGVDARYWYPDRRLRWGMVRRAFYAALMGGTVTLARPATSPKDVVILGAVLVGLLLWPILFHGLPLAIFRSDWQLVPTYGGIVAFFLGSTLFGYWATQYAREQGDGSAWSYVADHALEGMFWIALTVVGGAFVGRAREGLLKRLDKRREMGFERIAEEGDPFSRG